MAQMGVTPGAQYLGPDRAEAAVFFSDYGVVGNGLPKTRPASSGIKFFVGIKQILAAANATINAGFSGIVVFAGEGSLSAFLPGDIIFLRG